MIARYAQLKRSPIRRKRRKAKPGDDEAYLRWIRTLPCIACFSVPGYHFDVFPTWTDIGQTQRQLTHTEAAHVGKTRKCASVKCIDRETIPLCKQHHTEGKDSHHKLTARGGDEFFERHGLNRETLIAEYNRRFDEHLRYCA